jgi:hypothetical protein
VIEEHASRREQAYSARVALEQRAAELGFQRAERSRHRWLRHVQALRIARVFVFMSDRV